MSRLQRKGVTIYSKHDKNVHWNTNVRHFNFHFKEQHCSLKDKHKVAESYKSALKAGEKTSWNEESFPICPVPGKSIVSQYLPTKKQEQSAAEQRGVKLTQPYKWTKGEPVKPWLYACFPFEK